MRNTFIDPELQEAFDRDGYVVVPFLNEAEIKHLRKVYDDALTGEFPTGFHSTMHSQSHEYRRLIDKEVQKVFVPKTEKYLDNYQPLVACFVVKEPGPNSGFDFHLDWSMVNEKEHISLTFWTPLIDTNAQNGNLWVLKGSHKLRDTIRGGPGLFNYFCDDKSLSQSELVELPVKAGTAVVFDHKLWHGAPPNLGDETRPAINLALMPKEARSLHYNLAPNNQIEVFEVDADFYNRVLIDIDPDYMKSIGFIDIKKSRFSLYDQLANPPSSQVMHSLFDHIGEFPYNQTLKHHAQNI
ncbi:MAG: phytanoyl-CoA dioxygenase family protein [Bacteroidetes bacterium]|nr:phytanoyl-CoA dioxygenase family protein [Bacteroidota bacterium]